MRSVWRLLRVMRVSAVLFVSSSQITRNNSPSMSTSATACGRVTTAFSTPRCGGWGGGVTGTILLLGILALSTIRRVRKSLLAIGNIMTMASERLDLTVSADASRHDEVGNMARAFNNLMQRVSGALRSVSAASQSVSSASAQIAAGNEDLFTYRTTGRLPGRNRRQHDTTQ